MGAENEGETQVKVKSQARETRARRPIHPDNPQRTHSESNNIISPDNVQMDLLCYRRRRGEETHL